MKKFILSIVILILTLLTLSRNSVWKDDLILWQDVVRKSPGKIRPYINLAGSYLMRNRLDDALAVLFKTTEVFSDVIRSGNLYYLKAGLEIYLNFAAIYGMKGDIKRAMEFLQKAYETMPDSPKVNYAFAFGLMERGDLERAEQYLKNAIALAEDPRAYSLFSELCERQGRIDEAIIYIERASYLEPENSNYLTRLGYLLRLKGRLDEAEKAWLKAIRLDKNNADAYVNLGSLMYERGFLKKAYEYYRRALEIDPNSYEALVGAGNVIDELGNYSIAKEMYERAMKIDPQRKEAYIEYQKILKRQGVK
ncbi:MAG: tetratricopeptide repeat protein [Thermodesulfovibrionales bacterium]|nr:tetratricopeptide repeat protein [Thermodesulfovibrionales bacterium]